MKVTLAPNPLWPELDCLWGIFVVVQSLSLIWLFVTPWTVECQAPLSFTISWICSNSCPLSLWCYLAISSSAPFLPLLPSIVIHQSAQSVQSLSCVRVFVTPWIPAHQASLSIRNSQSLLKLIPIESVMPSNHLILCHSLLLLPPILPSIRVFSNESTLRIRWPKYWSFSFSISPSNEHPELISFRMDWLNLLPL